MALDYTSFQTEDFVLDESFQAYVTGADAAAIKFWQDWLATHPTQQPAADKARQLLLVLGHAHQPAVAQPQKEADLQRLRRAIRQPAAAPRLRVQRLWRQRVAAGVLLLLVVLGAGYWLWPSYGLFPTRYAAAAGQQRTVRLPDGSVVVLNGNSRLTTAATWDADAPREVWLEGEAFFTVNHLSHAADQAVAQATDNTRFVVHAGELSISVLGTVFNVNNRPEQLTSVTLNSGKVLVEHATFFAHQQALLAPGELAEYNPLAHDLVTRQVVPERFSAWTNGSLEFNHTPLPDIIRLLHDTYGLEVSVADPALLSQTVTGTLPSKNADVLLLALARTLGVRTERHGANVRFLPIN